jgi:hypothetical protein
MYSSVVGPAVASERCKLPALVLAIGASGFRPRRARGLTRRRSGRSSLTCVVRRNDDGRRERLKVQRSRERHVARETRSREIKDGVDQRDGYRRRN